ncbi:hypothetical protein SAMN02745751_00430 [Dethiosulfatibacter aminovorans DSM 17477]|uniref:Uncharacterized protein n=1 Tax=Dethiosulfatibacter aminovorans DSM 17477 TaxID=1121476 RepID=A0A1M6BPF3_9FIRM|nr:hypothetical protein [Dethiosulfatibacter aminovorans]SHI50680.1 hypothetical protein SAMN02745751_00430 [Dethiosulfatibacter aminovorans DSM 17477]
MNLGLILSIENKNRFTLSCKLGTSVIASKDYKKGLSSLHDSIDNFLSSHSFDANCIKSLTAVCDITGLNLSAQVKTNDIGYIQQFPGKYSTDVKKLDICNKTYRVHSINLGLSKDKESLSKIGDAVRYFNEKGIEKVGLNSYFSKSYPEIENSTHEILENLSNGRLEITKSSIFNVDDYISREHYLLTNLVYLDSARKLVSIINDALKVSSIKCPLYFLRGDGYLIDETSILKEPASTWLSSHTGKILGSSKIAGAENTIVISRIKDDITASGVSSSLPVLPGESTRTFDMKHPGFIPKIIHIKELGNADEMKDVINRFNFGKEDFFPLINLTGIASENFSLMNKYLEMDDSTELTAIGAASAFYSKNFTTTVFNASSSKIDSIKVMLLEEAERYFNEIKLNKKNISYDFSITPLKYMKYNSYFIKLSAKGHIS